MKQGVQYVPVGIQEVFTLEMVEEERQVLFYVQNVSW